MIEFLILIHTINIWLVEYSLRLKKVYMQNLLNFSLRGEKNFSLLLLSNNFTVNLSIIWQLASKPDQVIQVISYESIIFCLFTTSVQPHIQNMIYKFCSFYQWRVKMLLILHIWIYTNIYRYKHCINIRIHILKMWN